MIASGIPLKTESETGQHPRGKKPLSTNDHKLSQFLNRVRKRARRWILIEAISLIGLSVAVWFWGTLLLDWLIEPPPAVRLLAGGAFCLWIGTITIKRLVMRLQAPLRDEQLALLVERTHPELQDSLSTAVELGLGETQSSSSTIDFHLLDRTTSIAAASVQRITMGRLFRRTHLLRKAGFSSFSIGTMAAVLILLPTVRETWVQRMVLLSNAPWPRQVTLSIADFPNGVRRVARGVDVEILVTARSTGQLPRFVELQYRGKDGWTTHRMGTRGASEEASQLFTHIIKKPKEDLVIEVRGGDGRLRDLHLEVVEPPSLAAIQLLMTPPQYIGGGSRPLAATRLVEVPAGSILSITAESSKPLSKATIRSIPTPSVPQKSTTGTQASDAQDSDKESVIAQLTTKHSKTLREKNTIEKQPRDLSGTLGPVLKDCVLDIEFTDTTGITNQKPIRFQVLSRPDLPPKIEVVPDGISSVITTSAAIPISGRIEDDHGLAEVTVSLRGLKTTAPATDAQLQTTSISLATQSATVVRLVKENSPRIEAASLPAEVGDELELVVSAKDQCALAGGPQTSVTEPWRLRVVLPEVLLATLEAREVILRRRFESLIADFQQKRDRIVADVATKKTGDETTTSQLAEATSRANGETREIAASFRDISGELSNNRLLTAQLEERLLNQIATPLEKIVSGPIEQLRLAVYDSEQPTEAKQLIQMADVCLDRMRSVLDKMIELETYNEVIDTLRTLIEQQQSIRGETSKQQKQRTRDLLKGL
ncbi:MAG: hypothetical protein ABGW79_10065 [Pirellulales bacterium]